MRIILHLDSLARTVIEEVPPATPRMWPNKAALSLGAKLKEGSKLQSSYALGGYMISITNHDQRPFSAGETRYISINGSHPIRVRISCFVFKPPPPDYKPCDACGVLSLSAGQKAKITADAELFAEEGGELVLLISDAQGEEKEVRMAVAAAEAEVASNNREELAGAE